MEIAEIVKLKLSKLSIVATEATEQTETHQICEIIQFRDKILTEPDSIKKTVLFKVKFVQILQSLVSVKLQFDGKEKELMNQIFERSLNRIYGVQEKGIYLYAESSYKFENKSVSIIGNGTGKTTIMRAVVIFERYCQLAFTAPNYQLEYYRQILAQTPDYINCSHTSDDVRTTGLFPPECFYKNMLFDEVGKESKLIKHFGNDINFFTFIVEKRYRIVQDKGLSFSTNFTSNLPPEALIKQYGTHIFDRLTEMVDFIEMQGQSKRR